MWQGRPIPSSRSHATRFSRSPPENFAGNFAGDSTESSAGNSESTGSAPFSFDVSAARGAVALQRATIGGAAWAGGSGVAVPFLLESLEPVEQQVIELEKLRKFVERPVKALIRDRLGMGLVNLADDISDELPVEAGGLVEWQVGNRLLASALRGEDPMVARQAELARGSLPPGALGERAIEPITAKVALLQAASAEVRQGEPQVVDIAISLSDGTRVEGAVPGFTGTRWCASNTPSSSPNTGSPPGSTCSPCALPTPISPGARSSTAAVATRWPGHGSALWGKSLRTHAWPTSSISIASASARRFRCRWPQLPAMRKHVIEVSPCRPRSPLPNRSGGSKDVRTTTGGVFRT